MRIIRILLLSPFMIILVPIDYIAWNYFIADLVEDKKVTWKESAANCWHVLKG